MKNDHIKERQDLVLNSWHFCIKMQRYLVKVDDVNITLIELTVPPLLWSLASPYPLHLVAFEREHEVVEMFCDVARQGNRQIVMEAQARLACFVIHMQPSDG